MSIFTQKTVGFIEGGMLNGGGLSNALMYSIFITLDDKVEKEVLSRTLFYDLLQSHGYHIPDFDTFKRAVLDEVPIGTSYYLAFLGKTTEPEISLRCNMEVNGFIANRLIPLSKDEQMSLMYLTDTWMLSVKKETLKEFAERCFQQGRYAGLTETVGTGKPTYLNVAKPAKALTVIDKCEELAKHKETEHLVSWYGDYSMYEPALGVSKEDIEKAYDKITKKEQSGYER